MSDCSTAGWWLSTPKPAALSGRYRRRPGTTNGNNYYAINTAFEYQFGRSNTGLIGRGGAPEGFVRPENPGMPNQGGFLVAWDPVAQQERWRISGDGSHGGTLSTGGNLLFVGKADGRFQALDAETGETLWEAQTAGGPGQPVSYEIDQRQYVSVMAGRGGPGGAAVWTFALNP